MILKVFTQPSCPKCPAAKKIIKEVSGKFTIEEYDTRTEDGLAEALTYDVLATPSIIVMDDKRNVLKEWRGEAPKLEELNAMLK